MLTSYKSVGNDWGSWADHTQGSLQQATGVYIHRASIPDNVNVTETIPPLIFLFLETTEPIQGTAMCLPTFPYSFVFLKQALMLLFPSICILIKTEGNGLSGRRLLINAYRTGCKTSTLLRAFPMDLWDLSTETWTEGVYPFPGLHHMVTDLWGYTGRMWY